MEGEKIIESKNQNHRNKKRKIQEQFRVILGNKANESLERIVHKVNDNFYCGTITKSNVIDWLLMKLNGSIFPADVRNLRELHVDEKKMLQELLKESTTTDESLPANIQDALRKHFGFSGKAKRKSRKVTDQI